MAPLGDDEYFGLPDYLRKQLGLEMINDTIQKVNLLLLTRRESKNKISLVWYSHLMFQYFSGLTGII